MTIESADLSLKAIKEILPEVQKCAQASPSASIYADLHRRLTLIQSFVEKKDYSVSSKQSCDMLLPLGALYEDEGDSPLIRKLSKINASYQAANIPQLTREEVGIFLMNKR